MRESISLVGKRFSKTSYVTTISTRDVTATQSVERWEFAKYDVRVEIRGKKDVSENEMASSQFTVSSIHCMSEDM